MRLIDADALIADCQLAQKQADRHGREFANAFYSGGGEVSTEWWCVEDMIENAPTIEPKIVWCKDCKHQVKEWRTDKRLKDNGYIVCGCDVVGDACGYWALLGQDDDFCSYAERRTDERSD